MKVQVVVKNSSQCVASSNTIEATVTPTDTALTFQERIAEATNTLCFSDQQLLFKGQILPGNQRLIQNGIKDGDRLEFVFEASEQTLTKQLSELIGAKSFSIEELSLLYVHRHLVPLGDALKAIGYGKGKPDAFLDAQKCFSVSSGFVKVASNTPQKTTQAATGLCPIKEDKVHGPIEVKISVEVHVPGKEPETLSQIDDDDDEDLDSLRLEASETVARAKEIIAAFQQVPFPDSDLVLENRKLDDNLSLIEAGVTNGSALVLVVRASKASLASQLEKLLEERTGLSPNELSLLYCQHVGTPVRQALRTLGLPGNLRQFLQTQSQFAFNGGCITLANGPKLLTPVSWQDENSPPLNEAVCCQ